MMCNMPGLDLVNIKEYTKFCDKSVIFFLKILSGNEILAKIKGHSSGTNEQKLKCNNLNLDIVNNNAHKTFGEVLSFYS